MYIVIIGCGKTGARLASLLDERGYDTTVIDFDVTRFDNLSENFRGMTINGDVTDVETLRAAGCENADCAVVVTGDDNINVMAAQILQMEFDTEKIFVRVSDPPREHVFRKFGLQTICPTRFETDVLFDLVTNDSDDVDSISIGGNSVEFVLEKTDKKDVGKSPYELMHRKGKSPIALQRRTGKLEFCGEDDIVIEEGDHVLYAQTWGE